MKVNDVQLLCTFLNIRDRKVILDEIVNKYVLSTDKIYLMKTDDGRYFYSYNVDRHLSVTDKMKRTIMVHRKKETNTFFSINSLNELQKKIGNGVLDKTQEINWDNYRNKLMLYSDNILSINDVSVVDVITIKYIDKSEIKKTNANTNNNQSVSDAINNVIAGNYSDVDEEINYNKLITPIEYKM